MRTFSLIFLLLLSLAARAYDIWYELPATISSGLHIFGDTEDKTVVSSVFQLRGASKADAAEWGIVWNYTDTAAFYRARLTTPRASRFDDDLGNRILV